MKKLAPLVLAAAFALPAVAADPAWLADFRKADLNDSGGLSKVELDKTSAASLQPIKDHFAAIDADRDGQVTPAEYERYLATSGDAFAAKFKKADLNDSGGLSKKELDKVKDKDFDALKKNFAAIDSDQDGQVTLAEYQAWSAGGAPAAKAAASQCADCGTVVAIDRYEQKGEGSGLGAVAGGVAGGLLGNQVGKGTGNTIATVGGAAGGAYLGHQIEKKVKSKKMAKVTVRLDNGTQQEFHFEADKNPFANGERVRVKDGQLVKM